MQLNLRKLLIVYLGIFVLPVNAEVYKWRDARGVMNYSDIPPSADVLNAQKIKATVIKDEFPLTRSDAYQRNDSDTETKAFRNQAQKKEATQPPSNELKATEALQTVQDRIRAQNCASARSNYRNYAIGGRMQTVNEDGQKSYLSDEQIQQGLAAAQQEIDENCSSE